uniref:Helicase C-terminal domain-containing protein n=1 Tax=Ananas comosus var. bracteatus TaxID=296719 RepID=A0A6V7PPB3_ANACO|nr:unnamed protein product [Ananas comosus var. bracteatus]
MIDSVRYVHLTSSQRQASLVFALTESRAKDTATTHNALTRWPKITAQIYGPRITVALRSVPSAPTWYASFCSPLFASRFRSLRSNSKAKRKRRIEGSPPMAMARLLLRKTLFASSSSSSSSSAVAPRLHDIMSCSVAINTDLNCLLHAWCNLRFLCSYHSSAKFDLTDLTRPHTWYPNARRKKRNVFLHVGPTNSGKTYNALKRLESSSSGLYCGPLRLLAWEVAQRFNKAKCAIIDEIQMVGCRTRGFSFTRALLGICSDELHVCGDPAAVPLIQRILEVTGDVVKVQYYERLSPLVPLKFPLGSFSNIKTRDCIVTFSRLEIYKLKKKIENDRKHLCAVVYGSLPQRLEQSSLQATMFNDESSEFDVLVASDAIGMGLNLNISGIIFSTLKKFDGVYTRELSVPEIKQIAGRAGRYGSKYPVGEVTRVDADDLPLLHSSLASPSPVLERAGLFPTLDLLSMYSRMHATNNFHPILKVAAVLDDLPLGLYDKYLFCLSTVDMNDDIAAQGLIQVLL